MALLILPAARASAQATAPAAARPDDTPKVSVGATIFADYTFQTDPAVTDADGNRVSANSFNVTRSYINIIGSVSHLIGFRVTPDITREAGAGSSLNGSYTFRLKYAFAQVNLDDWMTHGSWLRLGLQQTPYIDYAEGIYRYRFQGPLFEDREGFLTSSDAGASFHYNFAQNYGELHVGVYNGEGYGKFEAINSNTKAFQIRGTVRPVAHGNPTWRGLRLTGFYDEDRYVNAAAKRRALFNATFEHRYLNAGFDWLHAMDQTSAVKPEITARGWSLWATPRSLIGWEALLRYDQLTPNTDLGSQKRKRFIGGIAYWFPHIGGPTAAILLDFDSTTFSQFTPSQPTQRKIGLHGLINF